MDSDEARPILAQHLSSYRAIPYAELARRVGTVETAERRGPSGAVYQIEIEIRWDSKPDGDLRVLGTIDDGRSSAWKPLCDDFIRAPDGRFIGE